MKPATSGPFAGLYPVDSDAHFSEPYDLWTKRAPAKYREAVPQVREGSDGKLSWFLNGERLFMAGGASFVNREGEKEAFFQFDITTGKSWEEIHAASYDAKARVGLMDDLGIWAQIVYPNTLGFAASALVQSLDRGLARTCVEIYNDAIAEWSAESGGRLFPQALLPFWSIDDSVAEAKRVRELGLTGVTMAGEPHLGGLPDLGQPDWEPLYEVLSDLALPINIHVGAANTVEKSHAVAWPSLEARATKPVNSVQMELANSKFISNLVVSDVLLKYPNLKWVSVESGIGWIPYVLERIDYEYREEFPGLAIPDRPTAREMFKRNIYGCFWFEYAGPHYLLEYLGADNVLWETDFPHPTCLHPSPVERSAEELKDLDPVVVRKIMQDNAVGLYGLELPALTPDRSSV
jgi:uncharacterized protein